MARMKYVEPASNTKGREYINRVLIPRFAERFKDQDIVVNVGKHRFWDYAPFFNRPDKFVEYINLDIAESEEPDIVDNITASKLEDGYADGILYVGMDWDVHDTETALKEILRILKPGGIVCATFAAPGDTRGGRVYKLDEVFRLFSEFLVDEMHITYGPIQPGVPLYDEGDPIAYSVIARKRAS